MADVTDEAQRLREQLRGRAAAPGCEAERLAAENARLLYDRQDELELLEMVAAASNEATAIEPALGAAIVHVCAHMRWPVGPRLPRRPGDRDALGPERASGTSRTRHQRYAAFRAASELTASAVAWLPEPRHGHRRVGLGDRPRRGAEPEPPRGGARGRAARGLRLPDPHRHPAGRRARVLHRRPRHPGSGAAARHGPDRRAARAGGRARALRAASSSAPTRTSRPSPTSPRTTWPSRCARSPAFVALLERQYGDRPRRPRARVHRLRGRRRRAHAADDRRPAAVRPRRDGRPAHRARRCGRARGRRPAGSGHRGGRARRDGPGRRAAGPARRPGPAAARLPQPAGQRDQVHRAGRRAAA